MTKCECLGCHDLHDNDDHACTSECNPRMGEHFDACPFCLEAMLMAYIWVSVTLG